MEAGHGTSHGQIRVSARFRFSPGGSDLSAVGVDLQVSLRPQLSQPQRVSVVLRRRNCRRGQSQLAPGIGRHAGGGCGAQARKANEPADLGVRLPAARCSCWACTSRMGCCNIRMPAGSRREGVELEINGRPTDWLEVTASYAVQHAHDDTAPRKLARLLWPSCISRCRWGGNSTSAAGCSTIPRA